jgi:spermidine synthase
LTPTHATRAAFLLSGMAGLVYEVLWSRYLGLFVGHGAYAQVLVLAVYLGGMAVGALAVSDLSKRLGDPLRWYAGAEVVLAAFGLAFHALFVLATDFSYDVLFPSIGSAASVGAARWAVAGILILPQAIVLGTTFPLMAAGLVRADRSHPGGSVASAYLLNTLGGAAGVLLAGFWLIGRFGLAGTSVAAALLNLAAAGLVLATSSRRGAPAVAAADRTASEATGVAAVEAREGSAPRAADVAAPESARERDPAVPPWLPTGARLPAVLLVVSFGTALASFAYEIGWIRMLSLVLGSATHAFELMLSAFILGIALGAWAIRELSDRSSDPIRLLGGVQVAMGLAALLSLPLYLLSFDAMGGLIRALSGEPGGYALFNLGRYGLCLLVMLPSTILAGATLPLITGALLRSGAEESIIGRVYGVNTMGSVAGAGIAGLLALPLLGLEGLIVAGAAIDVGLGLWLLERSGRWAGHGPRRAALAAASSAALFLSVTSLVEFSPTTITSGVYRAGETDTQERWQSLFYADGRTATVSAHIGTSDGVIVLATNGKPDASVGPRWILDRRDTLPELPIPQGRDYTTQVLAPIVGLAHAPTAVTAANVGHGSGMTATALLTSGTLERLVTIEIEPLMVEGSLVFLPANGPAFADPRATYVFDDAKSYFSYRRERFDVVFSEPSNPWVSGTASLFTREFYDRVTRFLTEDGVLAQWMHIYELDDDLFLSVIAALDAVFPSYRAYLVGDADVAIVASLEELGEPDWSVVETEAFRALTISAPRFLPQHMEALLLFDDRTFRSVLDGGVPVNSDYDPILDVGSERARFEQTFAQGVYSFGTSRVDLTRYLSGRPRAPYRYATVPAYGLAPAVLSERGAWLREAIEAGGGSAPEEFPEWEEELIHLQTFLLLTGSTTQLGSWETWALGFLRAENALHWGTSGWVDPTFYRNVLAFLDRGNAPPEAHAAVDLLHGYALSDWSRVAAAADQLVARVAAGERWTMPDVLLDLAVLAYLETGRPTAARNALEALAPRTGRAEWNLRNRLLRSLVEDAERDEARRY